MEKFLLAFGILCAVFTLLPFLPCDHWFVRVFDFPHAQLTILTFAILLGNLFYIKNGINNQLLCVAMAACFLYQLTIIYPYTILKRPEVLDSTNNNTINSIKLLSSNVYMENKNTRPLLTEVEKRQPDVVVLMETDLWWKENVKEVMGKYPYKVEYPLDNTYGILVYSKLKLVDPQVKFLIESDIPSVHTKVILPSGKPLQLYILHPTPPTPTENTQSTERDGELLLVAKLAKDNPLPVIVFGDLNDVAWSSSTRLFQKISGLLDPRIGRGMFNTFNAKVPFLRWPLDHIFHTNDFKLKALERLPYIGSDHFPVYAELSYEPIAKVQQNEPQASINELEEANEIINDAKKD